MSFENQLRDTLGERAVRLPDASGDLDAVRRRGHRRRRWQQGGVVAAVAVVVAAGIGVVAPSVVRTPTITPIGGDGVEALLILCDDRRCPAPDDADLVALEAALTANDNVIGFRYDTPERTRERFAEELGHRPALVDGLDTDRLPTTIELRLAGLDGVHETYAELDGVDRVVAAGGLPPPLSADEIHAQLSEDYDPELGPEDVDVLHREIIGGAFVVVAETPASDTRPSPTGIRGILAVWVPDPEGLWEWVRRGMTDVPVGEQGWTASDTLPDGARVVAWARVHDPNARIESAAPLRRTAVHHLAGEPSGLAIVEGSGDPRIVVD